MKCKCGKSLFFITEVHRYEPSFDRPDMGLAICVFCVDNYLKARVLGQWRLAPYPSEEASGILLKESVRKVSF